MHLFHHQRIHATFILFSALCILFALLVGITIVSDVTPLDVDNPRLLLISSSIRDADVLDSAAKTSVVTVRYDPAETSLDELFDLAKTAVDGRQAASIGIVTHDYGEAKFHLTGSHTVNLGSILVSEDQRAFWKALASLLRQDGRIDLFPCKLASGEQGRMLVSSIADITKMQIAASIDYTGNPESGGDWELETTGTDVAKVYFDSNKLSEFTGLLVYETSKINASDEVAGDRFGWSVDIYKNRAIVGAYLDDVNGHPDAGSAYIFYRNAGGQNNWGKVAKLMASDADDNDHFGQSVSIWKNYAVVGAPADNHSGFAQPGSAYVFYRNAGGTDSWGQAEKLIPDDAQDQHRFGLSVGISSKIIIVGAWADDDAGSTAGAAYIFEPGVTAFNHWEQVQKLTASDAMPGDYFGREVDIFRDVAVVGADGVDLPEHQNCGAAYVFIRGYGGQNGWGEVKKLFAPDASKNDVFGRAISIFKSRVLIGESSNDHSGLVDAGAAYIFRQDLGGPNNWGVEKKLIASDAADGDTFGEYVSMWRNRAIVGSSQEDHDGLNDAGAAYVFKRNSGGSNNWGEIDKLMASDAATNDIFGQSVATNGKIELVGAPLDADYGGASGSIYHYGVGLPIMPEKVLVRRIQRGKAGGKK